MIQYKNGLILVNNPRLPSADGLELAVLPGMTFLYEYPVLLHIYLKNIANIFEDSLP
jgi:hypothetical protein